MKALFIGATGATGKDLLEVLLRDPDYTEVVVFARRATGQEHPKLREHLIDLGNLEPVADLIHGDVWFSCLGTTLKAAGSKDAQWKIDFEIPAQFARIAKANGVPAGVLLSSYGASASSRVFYSRMKGELEDTMRSLGFTRLWIFRPGLLLRRGTDRFGERVFAGTLGFLNALGLFRKFRGMPTRILAEKLALAPKKQEAGVHVAELDKIFSL